MRRKERGKRAEMAGKRAETPETAAAAEEKEGKCGPHSPCSLFRDGRWVGRDEAAIAAVNE